MPIKDILLMLIANNVSTATSKPKKASQTLD